MLLLRLLLAALVLASAFRLGGFVARFGRESVQADFSAFYAAGEAVRHGLSPYRTHVHHDPPVWDGVSAFRHSRFLYPPLVASVFAPLTFLSFFAAKHLWMVFTLGCIAASVALVAAAIGSRMDRDSLLALGLWVSLFHPVLALLERGQIDALTLLLLVCAFKPLARGRQTIGSGMLLALATLLKLNVALVAPFLALRRRWRVLAGYLIGGGVLAILSLIVNGPGLVSEYVTEALPRIAVYGEQGSPQMRLGEDEIQALRSGVPEGQVVRQGRAYRREAFGFVANASLARVLSPRPEPGVKERQAAGAAALLALGFVGLMAAWQMRHARTREGLSPLQELTYWQIVLVVILLCGPLTWAMNTVWLLPAGLILREAYASLARTGEAIALLACALGLILAALPDSHGFPLLAPYGAGLLNLKYVVAEVLLFAGLLGWLTRKKPSNSPGVSS